MLIELPNGVRLDRTIVCALGLTMTRVAVRALLSIQNSTNITLFHSTIPLMR